MIAHRKDRFLFFQLERGKFVEQLPNDLFVLLGFDAARAVDEDTAWPQEWKDSTQNRELFLWHAHEVFRAKAPADVDAPSHHTGIAARRIDQDAIKLSLEFRCERLLSPILPDD